MSTGRQLQNAFTLVNLGCEMIYVLHHRLEGLDVEKAKVTKTLQDIAKTLFSTKILTLLFTPKGAYTLESIKSSLFQICHCSIITLDQVSFGKLFEMVAMSLKRQILTSNSSHSLALITNNHISGIDQLTKDLVIS
jgi:Organic solute transport protein 1